MRLVCAMAILCGVWSTSVLAASKPDAAFFEAKIRPVLVQHCYQCHSAESKITQGGLRVDHRAALLKGGDSGPAIVPGQPENSPLLAALRHEGLEMPPSGKLDAAVLADFETWIRAGAHDPREEPKTNTVLIPPPVEAAKDHWAFQPVRRLPPPPVKRSEWIKSPIDAFILAKLEQQGLQPAPPATKAELIRRVTFDLVGLPPTPAEVAAFEADQSPEALAKVVDRLLASPQYGERWGRHWLDLARYADTNGSDENHPYPNAWRYRDYVVRAFNNDLPYNVFIEQQLAGDLLPQPTDEQAAHDQLTATGFLVIGPKNLAEQDKSKMLIDIVDEQVDTVGRTFLGLTTGCARCHDHKFDPIPIGDYYALAGIFASTKTMANTEHVSQWNERPLPTAQWRLAQEANEKKIAAKRSSIHSLNKLGDSKLTAEQRKLPYEQKLKLFDKEVAGQIDALLKEIEAIKKELPPEPHAMAVAEGEPHDLPIHLRGSHLNLAKEKTPRGVLSATAFTLSPPKFDAKQSGRLELAAWLTSPQHPLTARVMVNRIWQKHFGRGIVETASNFGFKGAPPSHPELLDWLASEFVAENWSIKRLHRKILLSNTYAMSSRATPEVAMRDPDNRWLSHQNRRRLEAEPILDSIKAVAGALDTQQVGGANYTAARRTLYLPIDRSLVDDFLTTFDYADASMHLEERPTTTVPQQALFMLNSPILETHVTQLMEKVLSLPAPSDRERVEWLYQTLYARPAQPAEVARALAKLQQIEPDLQGTPHERRRQGWAWLCRTLIAANEFIYLN